MKTEFGLRARVHEDDRAARAAERAIDFRHRLQRHVPAPGQSRLGHQDADIGSRPATAPNDHRFLREPGAQPAREPGWIGHRRRQSDPQRPRRQRREAREAEREEIAALAALERVQLVDDDGTQARELGPGGGIGEHQRQRFRGRQQDLWRAIALARAARRRRVAGARLRTHRQPKLGYRDLEIAPDVHGERLERRDVERMQPLGRPRGEIDQARQEARERLAATGRRDQQGGSPRRSRRDDRQLVRMRGPTTPREPIGEQGRQGRGVGGWLHGARTKMPLHIG